MSLRPTRHIADSLDHGGSAQLLAVLESAGHEVWFVGGCVRDALLGRPISDIDFAVSARWQEVREACEAAGFECRETGVDHGTITVLVPTRDGMAPFEVTTFRSDSTSSSDSRHPDSVSFVSTIEEDLVRRDFTINAIAWNPTRGLIDPIGGIADLEKHVIRAVGDPRVRFEEDALRILRACRFASQLGFDIDQSTLDAMMSCKHLILRISVERVLSELDLFLLGNHVHDALMETADVISIALPEICAMQGCAQNTKYHVYDVLEHTAWTIQHSPPTRISRWAALCHDMGKPATKFTDSEGIDHFYGHAKVSCQIAKGISNRLSFSNKFEQELILLIREHGNKDLLSAKSIKRMLAKLGGDVGLFEDLVGVMKADILAHAPEYRSPRFDVDAISEILHEILESQDAFTIGMLDIDGNDLISAGMPQGPIIGSTLRAALDAVLDEEIPNDHADLLSFCMAFKQ